MRKIKLIVTILIGFSLIYLIGCNKTTTETTQTTQQTSNLTTETTTGPVLLYNVNLTSLTPNFNQSFTEVEAGEEIALPFLEKANHLFLGWTDGDNTYFEKLTVNKNLDLEPLWEDMSQVFYFDEETLAEENYVTLRTYRGNAKYMRIPQTYNGKNIIAINAYTFRLSTLEVIQIPNTVLYIETNAFSQVTNLKELVFYGDDFGSIDHLLEPSVYDQIINNYSDQCVILTETQTKDSWQFTEGCPIQRVKGKTSPIIIDEVEIFAYEVVLDLNYYESGYFQTIQYNNFSDSPYLEKVILSSRFRQFYPPIFYGAESLKNLLIDNNNPVYTSIDGVIYSKDLKKLFYYPQGLNQEHFIIPEFVETIEDLAFSMNAKLKTITIPANVINIKESAFGNLFELESFIVLEGNEQYYAIEGVLYSYDQVLVKYPPKKIGSSYQILLGTMTIGPMAFARNAFLETLVIPDGVKTISYMAFYMSFKIKVIDLPTSVETISGDSFHYSDVETVIVRRGEGEDGITRLSSMLSVPSGLINFYINDDYLDIYLLDNFWHQLEADIKPLSELK